jgi:hypothetical protein
MRGPCELWIETPGSIRGGTFLDQLSYSHEGILSRDFDVCPSISLRSGLAYLIISYKIDKILCFILMA